MTRYFLGVDIGGTKSHALIADEAGQAVGFGTGGPGNYEGVGEDGMTTMLNAITAQALAHAGISIDQIAGAGFGIAGYDWPAERLLMLRAIETLGLGAPFEFVNDTIIGLLAGSSEGWGVAVVAGTSNNCRGWDRDRREGRVTGQGAWFGEFGGAYELVMKAIHVVIAEWTMRGPPTRLTQAFVELTGAQDVDALVEGLCMRQYNPDADAVMTILEVAAEGDQVAQEIVAWTGRELGSLANGVIRQLGFESAQFEVVLVGSLYHAGPMLIEPMRETIHAIAPGARLVRLTVPPVIGGVLLGMEQAHIAPSAVRETLIRSTQALLAGEEPQG